MAGFPVKYAIWLVTVPNLILFLSNLIGLYLVERSGRRSLMIGSLAGTIIGLVILAVGFQLAAESAPSLSPNVVEIGLDGLPIEPCHSIHGTCESCVRDNSCGFCYSNSTDGTCLPSLDEEFSSLGRCNNQSVGKEQLDMKWAYEYCPSDYTWIVLFGMAVFVFAFSPGLGPMPWTINAEIYPLWSRSTCNSLAACTVWMNGLIISFLFLTMTEHMTIHGTFWFFVIITTCGVVLLVIFLPETKDKTLEEMEQLFMTPEQRESLVASRRKDGEPFIPQTMT